MIGPTANPLRVVIVGHVDHGKSTLVGRLFYDTNSLQEGKYEAIKASCERRGIPFEWAFLTDALQAERSQGITIDISHVWFKTCRRNYVIIDAPGHREFIKNMVTGAATAEAAILLIDASEGVRQQSRMHALLLQILGVRQLAVVVNKMDLVDYSAERFGAIQEEFRAYLAELGLCPQQFVPICARSGESIAGPSSNMPWYKGPTVLEALDQFSSSPSDAELPLRIPVQDVYKFDARRIIAGRVETGRISVGDEVLFSPSNKTARVASLEHWGVGAAGQSHLAGECVGITLDDQLFVERGEVISHVEDSPFETNVFDARVFWLAREPLVQGKRYRLKINTLESDCYIERIERIVNADTLETAEGSEVQANGVADLVIQTDRPLAIDDYERSPQTGRFVLFDGYNISGGGLIHTQGYPNLRHAGQAKSSNLSTVAHRVSSEDRMLRHRHPGGVLWMTGLPGAGKSTLAIGLERRLFIEGFEVYVLDGDNVRHGLTADLGFSVDDRIENVRRVGEVAALMADAGMLVIAAFISPYASSRQSARDAVARFGSSTFSEIYLSADAAACEARDPKGLYHKARAGELLDFTGVSAPYEVPQNCELVVDTHRLTVDESLDLLFQYVVSRFKTGK